MEDVLPEVELNDDDDLDNILPIVISYAEESGSVSSSYGLLFALLDNQSYD